MYILYILNICTITLSINCTNFEVTQEEVTYIFKPVYYSTKYIQTSIVKYEVRITTYLNKEITHSLAHASVSEQTSDTRKTLLFSFSLPALRLYHS